VVTVTDRKIRKAIAVKICRAEPIDRLAPQVKIYWRSKLYRLEGSVRQKWHAGQDKQGEAFLNLTPQDGSSRYALVIEK
jgi:hypothetical protein